jgi:hypothetical protein
MKEIKVTISASSRAMNPSSRWWTMRIKHGKFSEPKRKNALPADVP